MQIYQKLVLLSSLIFAAGPGLAASLTPVYPQNFDSVYWEKLLHYQNGKSKADGEKFFLSPQGKTNPISELHATIAEFKNPSKEIGWFNYPAQCVFRARYEFLKESGLLEGVVPLECAEFKDWKNGLNAQSLTLIYSSSYPNNPSSLFGHTLLRLNQKNKTNDLLDYAVAFSAIPDHDDSGFLHAVKGMFGGYKGMFEITKYYTKVNEYNNGESRDLIEYNLKMNEAELTRLIDHLWEMYQTTYFDYYFADENCSAVLADLLNVAYREKLDINEHYRWFYLPGEMIQHFHKLNLVESTHYRPSLKKQMMANFTGFSSNEINEVKTITENKKIENIPAITNAKVLDGVVSVLDFNQNAKKRPLEGAELDLYRKALIQRSKLGKGVKKDLEISELNRPEYGHRPQKVSLSYRNEFKNDLLVFELKQGYHDLMGNDLGFDRFSSFEILSFSLFYNLSDKKFNYDKVTIASLTSLHDFRFYDSQLAWKVGGGIDRIYDLACENCHKINGAIYGGLSHRPMDNQVISLMAGVFGEESSKFKKGYRIGPTLEFSYYLHPLNNLKLGLVNEIRWDATKDIKEDFYQTQSFKASFFTSKNSDLRYEMNIVSKFGLFKQSTLNHEIKYGLYF